MKLKEWYDYKLTPIQQSFLESPVEVYDLNEYIKEQTDNLEESFWYKKIAIFVTPHGNGCFVDYEAKGEYFMSTSEEIEFDTNDFDEEESKRVIYLRPTGKFVCKMLDVMDGAKHETVRADQFFTKATYNDRCYNNFVELVDYLERMSFFSKKLDAGLDNKESGEVLTESEKIKPETIYELSDDYVYTFVEDPVFQEAGDKELKVEDCEKEGWIQGEYIILPKGLQFKFGGAVNNILSFELPQLENKIIWFNDSDIADFIKALKEIKDLEEGKKPESSIRFWAVDNNDYDDGQLFETEEKAIEHANSNNRWVKVYKGDFTKLMTPEWNPILVWTKNLKEEIEITGHEDETKSLLIRIANELDMPEDAEEANYDMWNYNSLLHDVNNGRGDEWIEVFEEKGLSKKLLDEFKKLVGSNLEEDIEKHDTLNPVLFDGEEIKPEIKEAIEKVVKEFVDELKEDEINFSLKDIILLGSNVSYNYTKDSDLDVHLIADSSTLECPPKLQDKLYGAYRSIFNRNYDINIKGIPLEIFVELDEPRATSNGIYSLNSGWLKKPEVRNIPDLDKEAFDKLFGEWEERYNKLIGKK